MLWQSTYISLKFISYMFTIFHMFNISLHTIWFRWLEIVRMDELYTWSRIPKQIVYSKWSWSNEIALHKTHKSHSRIILPYLHFCMRFENNVISHHAHRIVLMLWFQSQTHPCSGRYSICSTHFTPRVWEQCCVAENKSLHVRGLLNDFLKIPWKGLHCWQTTHITEMKIRCICLEKMLRKESKRGCRDWEWPGRERGQTSNCTTPSLWLEKNSAWLCSHLRLPVHGDAKLLFFFILS